MKFVELTKITASGTEKFILNADLIQKVYVKNNETFINVKDAKAEMIAESYVEMKSILQANRI